MFSPVRVLTLKGSSFYNVVSSLIGNLFPLSVQALASADDAASNPDMPTETVSILALASSFLLWLPRDKLA